MNRFACGVMLLMSSAWSQVATDPAPPRRSDTMATEPCAECGVVRSLRRVEKEVKPTPEDRSKPSGFVASVPFDGGKPTLGSSLEQQRDDKPPVVTYEFVVRMDDGRFRIVVQDDNRGLREGDKVRIDKGKVILK